MEEKKPNIPVPPENLRKMPPPPPPRREESAEEKVEEQKVEEQKVEEQPKGVEAEKAVETQQQETAVQEEQSEVAVENIVEEKTSKKDNKIAKKAKGETTWIYWLGFVFSLALIGFCVYMLVK